MANKRYKNYYNEKVGAVAYIIGEMKKAKLNDPTEEILKDAAVKYSVPLTSVRKAWSTVVETGTTVSRRCKAGGNGKRFALQNRVRPAAVKINPTFREACIMLLDWMNDKSITTHQLSVKHGIDISDFYKWLREIENHGTMFGYSIVQPSNFAKYNVPDAVWYVKKGKGVKRQSISNLHFIEQRALENFGNVIHNKVEEYVNKPPRGRSKRMRKISKAVATI